ncbi:MAG: LysE family transporter [Dehalococcoidia bacterium]|nr:LysE family transporter [Dehalococcoidia bacterium]
MSDATLALIFGTSFVVGLSGAISPGPLLTLDIREAARRGFWAGPLIVLGHGILELVLVVALALGLRQFLDQRSLVAVVSVLGGLFLVWLGVQLVRRPGGLSLTPARLDGGPNGGGRNLVLAGALVSLANPYWSLWWATIGLGYLVWALGSGVAGLASFFSGHILADLAWFGLVALAVASGRRLVSDAVYRGVSIACGVFMVVLGLYFIGSGTGLVR